MTDTAKTRLSLWVTESHEGDMEMSYRVRRTLFSGESEFQHIDIVETTGYGRMLFNDGVVMISERDEFVYHEMISHVPMFVHPGVSRALVIGGGDGGTVREILRHPTVEHCRLVEIDPLVVDGCRKHIPQTAAALDDERVEVSIADGVKFVAETAERYDLVIVDSTDPIGPATPLFGAEFYSNVHRVLKPDGIVVSQAESPFYDQERQRSMLEILGEQFERVHVYNYNNLTYPGGLWSFTYATRSDRCPIVDLDVARAGSCGLDFQYYSPELHRAAFVLPAFQSAAVSGLVSPFKRPPTGI